MKKYLTIIYEYVNPDKYISFITYAKTYSEALSKSKLSCKHSELYNSLTAIVLTEKEIKKMKNLVNFYERNFK